MQVTIEIPDNLQGREVLKRIKELQTLFLEKSKSIAETQASEENDDPWDRLKIEDIAVDTGIEDFAENHDHYLYGTPKRS